MTKIKLLFLTFILLFGAIIVKLSLIQIIQPNTAGRDAYLHTNKIYPERGQILDRNNAPLALNQNSYLLYIEPKKIDNQLLLVRSLSSVLAVPEASIEAKIDETKVWVAISAGIDDEKKKALEALHLSGIGFDYQMKRYYPEASLSAHLLGFVGKNTGNEDVGYFGLEGFYDTDLKGLPGLMESERDLAGRPILIGTQERVEPENGRNLILTMDKTVQEISKRILLRGMETYKAKQGCTLTADPATMQILAMVCLPDYDVDKYYLFSEEFFKNPAISDVYEPGSIFKPLIMAAALQEKKIKAGDFYDETGPVKIGEYSIKTWNDKYEGKITMTRILEKSSNVGMVYIGEKLGDNQIYSYLRKYGFGSPTNIDLQGENPGYLKPKNDWYPIDYSTVTFGQGIAVTPLQMLRAFASVINGGLLLKPYVVQKMVSSDKTNAIQPKVERRVISELTSAIIRKMLVAVVNNGEVHWAKPKGYTIGGKTGTAQIPIQGHYDPSKTIASFIGFAPADKPKFITMVMLKEPESSQWGSETAAPIFFDIAKELIVYYNIAPDQ